MPTSLTNNAEAEIAVVDGNALAALGLAQLLAQMLPSATVRTFNSFLELTDDTPDAYFHYFVSSQILIEQSEFFVARKRKVIVLTTGLQLPMQLSGFHTLNICRKHRYVVEDLASLFRNAHNGGKRFPPNVQNLAPVAGLLSPREIEVLVLVVKGLINKQIADKLAISLPTVVSHRQNITEKLGIKSVSGLTIFAVANGLVEASRI